MENRQETHSACNCKTEHTCAEEFLPIEKKDAKSKGAGVSSKRQKRETMLKHFNFHRCCLGELPSSPLQWAATFIPRGELIRKGTENCLMLTLMSRKAAIPVPGPIGGGSLSDWKEAEGTKGDVKSSNSKSGNTEAGNSKD